MKILEVKPSTRKKGRILVKLDDGTLLRVSEQEVLEYTLYAGKEISVEEAKELEESGISSFLKNKALNYISRKMVSRRDLEKKILEWDGNPEEVEEICQRFEELGLINDEHYARVLAENYHRKGYGLKRIQQEFYKHGVPRELWEDALAVEEIQDSQEAIDKFILQKCKGEKPDQKEMKRVSDALARRGFGWSEIRSGFLRYEEELGDTWALEEV